MLDELGPTFVKFGQLLSMRPDVLPPDIIAELRGLQDDVTPFSYEEAAQVIEESLGQPVDRLFLEFDSVPMAAASIGQVHGAVLPNGRRVAVKVQRPDAPGTIEADLELLYQVARLVRERVKALQFIDSVALVDEFARTIRQELDYRMEARNAEQFHRNFAGHPHVRVPRVFWSYSRTRVLTLEFLNGVHLRDLDFSTYTIDERRRHPHHRHGARGVGDGRALSVGVAATVVASVSWPGSRADPTCRVATTPSEPATNRLTRTMATKVKPTALSALDWKGDGSGSVCMPGENARGPRHATSRTNR
jgi:hypothetical protein